MIHDPVAQVLAELNRREVPGLSEYRFTQDWFSGNMPAWREVLERHTSPVRNVLEIGSYEGRSTVWLIENVLAADGGELVAVDACVDDGFGDPSAPGVLERFRHNVDVAVRRSGGNVRVRTLRGFSHVLMPELLAQGHGGSFDLVYVDGSHVAADVLSDLVMAFHLCRIGGLIFCDDYLWSAQPHGSEDVAASPKLAIDAFVNCFRRRVTILPVGPLCQIYLTKTAA